MRRLGVHTSIAGGIHNSLERSQSLGCNTLQIFSHNPRGWAIRERDRVENDTFRALRTEFALSPVYIHSSYLINLASPDALLLSKSMTMVTREMDLADALGAEYVVLHTGSASGDDPAIARKRAISALAEIAQKGNWQAGILLENTAGERGDITSEIRDLAEILMAVPGTLIAGICIDTCHAFAAGYDVSSMEGVDSIASEIERYVGRKKLKLVHLNDSKGNLGSHIDRHDHIGEGRIGLKGLRSLINHPYFFEAPLILETPKKTEADDIRNLSVVRNLLIPQ